MTQPVDVIEITTYHVRFRTKGVWLVERAGAQRPSGLYPNPRRAETAAMRFARNHTPSKVVVHNPDGSIARETNVGVAKDAISS